MRENRLYHTPLVCRFAHILLQFANGNSTLSINWKYSHLFWSKHKNQKVNSREKGIYLEFHTVKSKSDQNENKIIIIISASNERVSVCVSASVDDCVYFDRWTFTKDCDTLHKLMCRLKTLIVPTNLLRAEWNVLWVICNLLNLLMRLLLQVTSSGFLFLFISFIWK